MTLRSPPAIDGFAPGGFRIEGVWRAGSVLIVDDEIRPFSAHAAHALRPADLSSVFQAVHPVEFVVLGAGPVTSPVPRDVREALAAAGIGLEVAGTPEACRLYNYLAGEGRRLAAALIAV